MLNNVALGLYGTSWLLRKSGRRRLGVAVALGAGGVLGVSGYLGGHMASRLSAPPKTASGPAEPPTGDGPADLAALPSPAGTARFDALLGIHYFASFYARNTNVFGAMPSLHASYPFSTFPVPGARTPVSGLTWVSVHPGHRRRGLLRTMIDDHFRRSLARGEAVSALFAAEPGIYGRFGYGLAAQDLRLKIPRGAGLREDGQVRRDHGTAALPKVGREQVVQQGRSVGIERGGGFIEQPQRPRCSGVPVRQREPGKNQPLLLPL